MEDSSKDDDDAVSLDHCTDSSSLDSYLHHFGDLMEIGDEVTVTDFPLTYHHDNTDHSYISTSQCSPTTTIQFNDHDCISEVTTGLSEFHELFDYPAFAFDLQEQVIESSKNEETSEVNHDDGLNQSPRNHLWMYSGLLDENCDNEEDEEEEEEEDASSGCETRLFSGFNDHKNINKNHGQQQDQQQQQHFSSSSSNHHTGAFPHTYIPMAGDRRIRFCLGLQTIVTKIKTLMGRTGATAEFRAEFENHVFTLDNADKILKFLHRSHNNNNNKKMKDDHSVKMSASTTTTTTATSTNNLGSSGGQDDHLYAATILTQTESSSTVRDHQYNEVTTTNSVGNKDSSVDKAYIPTRYARERWLRKGTTTIYTKMQRLKNRTGAKMALLINYQGIVISPKNYKDVDQMLEKHRPNLKLKKYNTEIIVQNDKKNDEGNFLSAAKMGEQYGNNAAKRIETVMKVSLPPKKAKNHSFTIEFLKMDQGNPGDQTSRGLLQTVVESDHDYDSQSVHEQKDRAKISNSDTLSNINTASSTSSSSSHHDFGEFSPPQGISISDGEIELTASSTGSDAISSSEFSNYFSFCSSVSNQPTSKMSKYSTMSSLSSTSSSVMSSNLCEQQQRPQQLSSVKTDVSTSTDPSCGVCGNSQQAGKGKFPNWIRCAHTLCHYLVHPHCLGFLVMNPQHLHFLPPYFCPTHREDGFS